MTKTLIFILSILVGELSLGAAAPACYRAQRPEKHKAVHLSPKQSERFLDATKPDRDSTTAARGEDKATVSIQTMERLVQEFKTEIENLLPGFVLSNRDPVTPGKRNVTWTAYSNRFKLHFKNGIELTAKIRVRKYGWIDSLLEVSKQNFEPLPSMKDISFLEFKIQNPQYEKSVLKPRIKVCDADANLLLRHDLTKAEYQEIIDRSLALNKKTDPSEQAKMEETVFYMMRAIRGLHKQGSVFRPEFETIYDRVSYVIPLKPIGSDQVLDVQITIDRDIETYSILLGRKASTYSNTVEPIAVGETKTPIPLIENFIKTNQIDQVPGLSAVLRFVQKLEFNGVQGFETNHGKLFHGRLDFKAKKTKSRSETEN